MGGEAGVMLTGDSAFRYPMLVFEFVVDAVYGVVGAVLCLLVSAL